MAIRPALVCTLICTAAIAASLESFVLVRSAPGYSPAGAATSGPVMLLLAGWATVAAGVAVRWRHPAQRSWVLLVVAGSALFVAEWDNPTATAAVFSTGLTLNAAGPAVIAHFALSFPSGRLTARSDQAVVAIGYAVTVGLLGLAAAATFDPASSGAAAVQPTCGSCAPMRTCR